MTRTVQDHVHVNVHELRPWLTLGVDVVVDVHVDVDGFFTWLRLRHFRYICDLLGSASRGGTGGAVYCGEGRDLAAALSVWE